MTAASTNARLPRVAINGFGRIGRTIMRIATLPTSKSTSQPEQGECS